MLTSRQLALMAGLLSLCTYTQAAYQCTNSDLAREIRLDYPGQQHLCEVSVIEADGSRDVKWYANRSSAFCRDKLRDLVGKYATQWGFDCQAVADTRADAELTERQWQLVDDLLLATNAEGKKADIKFKVRALYAFTKQIGDSRNRSLWIQLITAAEDPQIKTAVDHIYWINDTDDDFETKFVWSNLADSLKLSNSTQRVVEAKLDGILAADTITVATLLEDNQVANETLCQGKQTMVVNSSGELLPQGPHLLDCAQTAELRALE